MSNTAAKYDSESGSLNFSLSIASGNICYFVQSIFFFIAAIGMYMIYCEANMISNLAGSSVYIDQFNLLFCSVALLLLNETFFIPDRWRLLCKMISAFLIWNNFETAACSAKSIFNDVTSDTVSAYANGDQVRIARAGMLFVLLAVVGSFLASYLVPNGRSKTTFSSYKFVKSSVLQSVFYCIAVVCLLVATFVQWSRSNTCSTGGATTATDYNATLLFLAFWFIFGLCTNDANTLDIAYSIIAQEIIKGRPTSFTETKIIVVYSLVFVAAFLVVLGGMLHSGIYLGKFTTTGIAGRIKSIGFAVHVISLILGISGSACIFSATSDKDQLWVAFWAGWGCPLLGLLGHIFDSEAALLPALFYVPQAFLFYGGGFAVVGSASYPKGYMRAGGLLLMIVPVLSIMAYYTKSIEIKSLDTYLKLDGAATMRSAGLLLLASSLLWKISAAAFWAVAFIAFMIFASAYNPRSVLPKAALLLAIQSVTVKALWLFSNDAGLTSIPSVVLVIGFWVYIATFGGASTEMSTGLECVHEITGVSRSGEEGGNDTSAPLIDNDGYTAVGVAEADEEPSASKKRPAPPPEPTSDRIAKNQNDEGVYSAPAEEH